MPQVNPSVLRWARETAGLTLEEAVVKIQLPQARGVSAVDRLAALEAGEVSPTRPMLVRMARSYHRPLLALYLQDPPRRGERGNDFRTLPPDSAPRDEALLDALLRSIRARQSMVRAVLEDEDEASHLPFIGSKSIGDGATAVLDSIQNTLRITLQEFRAQTGSHGAFGYLRSKAEAAGVFVLLVGDLGSHHTALDLQTFRGFALADDIAPFVVINDHDSKAAWSFTLLHELVHLWLGQTGVSNAGAQNAIERFCNAAASEFLMPRAELAQFTTESVADSDTAAQHISKFASARNLSSTMVAYRLLTAGVIDDARYRQLSAIFRQWWMTHEHQRREAASQREGGPDYYTYRSHRVGGALLDLVARMLQARALTTTKAGKILGVRGKNVQSLLDLRSLGRADRSE